MLDKVVVKIVKSGNRYNALDINDQKWTSNIGTSTRKGAYKAGMALMRTETTTGKPRWVKVSMEEFNPSLKSDVSMNQNSIVEFIHKSYSLKPAGLKILELKWKHLIRSAVRGKNILITGPKGTGKTLTARSISAAFPGRPSFDFNLGATQDPRASLIGNTQFNKKDGTFFAESYFVKAIKTKNAIIRLDELSRAHPEAWNILMTVLDEDQRYLRLDEEAEQSTVKVAEGVTFIATANIGTEYTSTRSMDAALIDRFTIIEMDVLSRTDELDLLKYMFPQVKISRLDSIASITEFSRKEYLDSDSIISAQLSTRVAVEMASMMWDGFTLGEIAEVCVFPEFSADGDVESERTMMSQFVQKFIEDDNLDGGVESTDGEADSNQPLFDEKFINGIDTNR